MRGDVAGTYVVAAVAGEGEEVDLPAVADAAVLPQIGELRRAHRSRRIFAPVEKPEPPPPRDVARPGREGGRGKGNRRTVDFAVKPSY
jgi:hypothetical protein